MLLALIEDLMPPPSWKAEGHVASPKHEWFWVVAKLYPPSYGMKPRTVGAAVGASV